MALIDSNKDVKRVWFVSFANRKLGDDIEANSCKRFEQVIELSFSRYAAILLMIASRAGYMASNFPLLPVMRVCIDCYY